MNDVRSSWSEHKFSLYGKKCTGKQQKSLNKEMEEQSTCFIYVYYSPGETERQFTFNKYRTFGAQILLIQNAWAAKQILPKLS